jgi:hypothetical protein
MDEHGTGAVVTSVFGHRNDGVLWQINALLASFGLTRL